MMIPAKTSKSICYWVLLILVPYVVYPNGPETNTEHRKKTSLNGEWSYIVDPYETGYYNFRREAYDQMKGSNPAAFFNDHHPSNKQELVEYDFDRSLKMSIPGDWNSKDPTLLLYEGTVWFRKTFDYSREPGRRLFVYFGAVNYKAEIYLNGTKLGTHEGGFTPFSFEATGIVKPKGNFLVVKVDNSRRKDAVPTVNTDWWNYGGITRDVLLIDEPDTYIRNYTIQLTDREKQTIHVKAEIANVKAPEGITITIPELKVEENRKTNEHGSVEFEVQVRNVDLWSPENPKLYHVYLKTRHQALKDSIGFRTIETRGEDILLNGKPVFLRGISIHEENASGGRGFSRVDGARLLNWAKDLGCNFVRLAHYPHSENTIRLADELGLLVWEEIPVYWTIDFTNENVFLLAKQQLGEMIRRDTNRASVVIWSVANETPVSEDRNRFLGRLIEHARTLDSTRLISAALLHRKKGDVETIDDPIRESLDIISFNQYLGWYGGNLEDAEKIRWEIPLRKPVVVSEFGGDAKFGLHGPKEERWTEEYQEYLYRQNLKMIDRIPNIRGLSPWILVDFRSPRRLLPGVQDGYNRKGLISNNGDRKLAFFVLQDYYAKKGGTREYKLVWSDEFDKDGPPDPVKWNYESGFIRNHEMQYYTGRPENARVEDGHLLVEARKEAIKNAAFKSVTDKNWRANREFSKYTSASVTTRGKAAWLYGKIEVRAKLPSGVGGWPAIWMLGENIDEVGWPKCGEIDIMEHVGFDPGVIHGTVHTEAYNHIKGTQKGKKIRIDNVSDEYHVYSIEWTPERIDFMVDGVIYNTFINEHKSANEWAFDQNFHLKINNAIGGDWGGQKGIDDASFPQQMYVDYVRVYQLKERTK